MTQRGIDCNELVEVVTEYLEGSMPAADRKRFDEHLEICEGCETYLAQYRQTIQLTGKLATADVGEPARGKLLAAFRGWKASRSG